MPTSKQSSLARAGSAVAYAVLGFVGTAALAVALLPATEAVQRFVYDPLWPRLGPSDATEAAILVHFVLVGVVAVAGPAVLAEYLSDRLANRRALAAAIGGLVVLAATFVLAVLAGLGSLPLAIGLLAVGVVGLAALLRFRLEVESGAVPALLGGVPALVVLLLLAGFGLGWGWGFVLVAQEVPASSVDGSAATFEDAPAVREDLFAGDSCETDADGRRTCTLQLRGYVHERAAARALARAGGSCPYRNTPAEDRGGPVVVRHDGSYYSVTCSPHGD